MTKSGSSNLRSLVVCPIRVETLTSDSLNRASFLAMDQVDDVPLRRIRIIVLKFEHLIHAIILECREPNK